MSAKRRRQRGTSVVEAALMMPWLAFLFVGTLDFGFYAYAAICTQNAARAAAIRTSGGSTSQLFVLADAAARAELSGLPNMPGVTSCAAAASSITAAVPCAVAVTQLNNSTTPQCADCALNSTAKSAQVAVTYQTAPMIPIPGVLTGTMRLTRIAEARIGKK